MFDINRKPDLTAWVNFSEDEKYLIKYFTERKKLEKLKQEEIAELILTYVLDWEGITANGEKLECNDENKRLVFFQQDLWSVERFDFIAVSILNQKNFYNYEEKVKNWLGASS